MQVNERIETFIQLQDKNIEFEEISKEIGVKSKTLRVFLNKNGYKLKDGKYINEESNVVKQIAFKDIDKEKKTKSIKSKKTTESKQNNIKEKPKVEKNIKKIAKDKKINMTVEDMDKLCEVYDWYMIVKDYKVMSPKKINFKKDINIEKTNISDLRSTSIKVEKSTWEEFERLCSNSSFNKQQIITQALKEFIKQYKHLV